MMMIMRRKWREIFIFKYLSTLVVFFEFFSSSALIDLLYFKHLPSWTLRIFFRGFTHRISLTFACARLINNRWDLCCCCLLENFRYLWDFTNEAGIPKKKSPSSAQRLCRVTSNREQNFFDSINHLSLRTINAGLELPLKFINSRRPIRRFAMSFLGCIIKKKIKDHRIFFLFLSFHHKWHL